MTGEGRTPRGPDAGVGLCAGCLHAVRQANAKGSVFWRCRAADADDTLPRYPPLPVVRCHAYARDADTSGRGR